MNKQEALQKIKELQEYIEDCDKKPELKKGQLWKHEGGTVVMISGESGCAEKFTAVCIAGSYNGDFWCSKTIFGIYGNKDNFTYLGMASDLLTVKT